MAAKILTLLAFLFLSVHMGYGQIAYNPFTQNLHYVPEPTPAGFECGTTQQMKFIAGLLTEADATQFATDPLQIVVCISGFEFDGPASSIVSGTYASNFTWAFQSGNPNCIIGTQSQILPGTGPDPTNLDTNSTGSIIINLLTPLTSPAGTVLSVNISLNIPAYMAATNTPLDDNEISQTQIYCNCNPLTSAGSIDANQTYCGPTDPTTFNSVASPTGGYGGTIEYQWQEFVGGNWVDIVGANTETYDASLISSTIQYRRNAKRSLCGTWLNSNEVTVTIHPVPAADAGPGVNLDCITTTATIGTPAIAGISYSWTPVSNLNDSTIAQPIAGPLSTTIYTLVVTDTNGCSASDTVVVNVAPPTSDTTNVSVCLTYTWSVNGNIYTTSGQYSFVQGCHTKILNLTILPGSSSKTLVTACDTFTWSVNNILYSTGGTYTSASTNANGCPQNDTLILTIHPSTSSKTLVTACDTFTWSVNNILYSTGGTYTSASTNANGCPQNDTLVLTIHPSTSSKILVTACDTFTWSVNNILYSTGGTYTSASTNANGCPQNDTLVLTINPSTSSKTLVTACDTFRWSVNNILYSSNGTYAYASTNASGCPQNDTLILTIHPSTSSKTLVTACDTFTWSVNNILYSTGGTYTSASTNANGCPQNDTLILTIHPSTSSKTLVTACDTFTWSVNNILYSTGGTYTSASTNANGCPQNDTLLLTLNLSTSSFTTVTACDTFKWAVNNTTYAISGTYYNTSTNANNCPQIDTLALTINMSTITFIPITACDTFTWSANGMTYDSSGIYQYISGCDIQELHLTIIKSTSTYTNQTACDSYTWAVNGVNYTTTGVYTVVNGCHVDSLDLTIKTSPVVTAPNVYACPGYPLVLGGSPAGGTWDLPNPYTGPPTTYTYYYTAPNGCTDSATASTGLPIVQCSHVDNITGISAHVHYFPVGGIAWYELRWRPVGSTTWTVGTNSTYLVKIIPNLIENTEYEVQVRGFCSYTSSTAWSTCPTFTTNNICGIPTGLSVSNVSCTSAFLTWLNSVGGYNYTVRWRKVGTSSWTTGSAKGPGKLITGLQSNSTYEFQVRSDCVGSSGWSLTFTFSTCPLRYNVDASVSQTSNAVYVYPNPAKDILHVQLQLTASQLTTMVLRDMSGRIIREIQTDAIEGTNTVDIPLSSLAKGVYWLDVHANGLDNSVHKIIKE